MKNISEYRHRMKKDIIFVHIKARYCQNVKKGIFVTRLLPTMGKAGFVVSYTDSFRNGYTLCELNG